MTPTVRDDEVGLETPLPPSVSGRTATGQGAPGGTITVAGAGSAREWQPEVQVEQEQEQERVDLEEPQLDDTVETVEEGPPQ